MIKPFNELYEADVQGYIEKKPTFKYDKTKGKVVETDKKLDYISWVNAVILLHLNGAESVKYGNYYWRHHDAACDDFNRDGNGKYRY